MLNAVLSASPVPATNAYANVFPASGSVELRVPTVAFTPEFSGIDVEDNARSVGASFTSLTVMTKAFSVNNPP